MTPADAGLIGFVFVTVVGIVVWSVKRLIIFKDQVQKDTDKKQTEAIESMQKDVYKLQAHVEQLERIKMSEDQTRKIVVEMVEGLKDEQRKTNSQLEKIVAAIQDMHILLAKEGFLDRRHERE